MKRVYVALLLLTVFVGAAFAVDVPPVTPPDFTSSPEAAFIWQTLAGQGVWGAILFAIISIVWRFAKPYLDEWMRQRKLSILWETATTGVIGATQTYVEAAKAGNGGKLTEEQAEHARSLARTYIITFMRTQGVDVLREYGEEVLNYIIEAALRMLKIESAATRAVAVPLSESSDSAPLPQSVTEGVMPA